MPPAQGSLSLINEINKTVDSNSLKIKSLTVIDHIIHVIFDEPLNSKHKFEPFFFFGYNEKEHKSVIVEGGIFGDTVVEHIVEFDGKLNPQFILTEFESFVTNKIQYIREEILGKMPS
jgi:hypothetical protein